MRIVESVYSLYGFRWYGKGASAMPAWILALWIIGFWPMIGISQWIWSWTPNHTPLFDPDMIFLMCVLWVFGLVGSTIALFFQKIIATAAASEAVSKANANSRKTPP